MNKRNLAWLGAGALALLAGFGALQAGPEPAAAAPVVPVAAAPLPPAAPPAAAPFSADGMQARLALLAVWLQRLARARQSLDSYRESTRYPHESRPIGEHPDQQRPFDPIADDKPLRNPGGEPARGVHLRTTQERVFVSGAESVRFTVTAENDAGKTLPLLVTRAVAFDLPDARQAIGRPQVAVSFTDGGTEPDLKAGDGIFSAKLQPSVQGFADYAGTIRLQLQINQDGQQGTVNFDVVYEPQVPAVWVAGVREALQAGSLNFYLKANVSQPGRYVVSARVDDANGKSFALLGFNDEVAVGMQEIRLVLFGKLIRDGAPVFPLTLRDVEGFLLIPDRFPDRAMMPRLAGRVHVSGSYPLAGFSDAEWTSEERERYLAELTRDVDQATGEVDRLTGR